MKSRFFGTLDRYLFRELLINFSLGLIFLSLLVSIVFAMKAVDSGYSIKIILPWIIDSLLYSLYFTTPISILVSCTLSYGRFVADLEYTAAMASGITPTRLFLPMQLLAIPVALFLMLTQSTILPELQHRKEDIGRFLVKQLENLGNGKMGQLRLDSHGGLVHWKEIRNGKHLTDVFIEKQMHIGSSTGGIANAVAKSGELGDTPGTKIRAERAQLSVDDVSDMIRLTLNKVEVIFPVSKAQSDKPDFLGWHSEKIMLDRFNIDFPINTEARRLNDLPTSQLQKAIEEFRDEERTMREQIAGSEDPAFIDAANATIRTAQKSIRKGDTEIWRRRAMALAVITFALLGFPLALILKRSQKLIPFFFGMLTVLVVFFPLTYGGIQMSRATGIPAWITVMSGNYAVLLISIGLMYRVRTHG
ncbi:MAG: LptF/LptG family permease [Planctomycetota bacterium]|nr:LptF/LptG family permease [Planctomycetota bacterium]